MAELHVSHPKWVSWVGGRRRREEHFDLALEHQSLRALVYETRDVISAASFGRSRGERRRAQRSLAELSRELVGHFEREERGGHLAEALLREPRLGLRAQELYAQHEPLLHDLTAIRALARAAGRSQVGWAAVLRRYHEFGRNLVAHEIAEGDIVRDALLRDLGSN